MAIISLKLQIKFCMTLELVWHYTGALVLALIIIYGVKNYWITLVAGFVVFCAFYFTYDDDKINLSSNLQSMLNPLKNAAIIYSISYLFAAGIYTVTSFAKKNKIKRRSNVDDID